MLYFWVRVLVWPPFLTKKNITQFFFFSLDLVGTVSVPVHSGKNLFRYLSFSLSNIMMKSKMEYSKIGEERSTFDTGKKWSILPRFFMECFICIELLNVCVCVCAFYLGQMMDSHVTVMWVRVFLSLYDVNVIWIFINWQLIDSYFININHKDRHFQEIGETKQLNKIEIYCWDSQQQQKSKINIATISTDSVNPLRVSKYSIYIRDLMHKRAECIYNGNKGKRPNRKPNLRSNMMQIHFIQ